MMEWAIVTRTMTRLWVNMASWSLLACLMVGCAATAGPADSSTRPAGLSNSSTDGTVTDHALGQADAQELCASRMHDLAGLLLLHYTRQGQLPTSLAQLGKALPGMPVPVLSCPASDRPFVYNPVGIYLPDRHGYLVTYEASAAHGNFRWCILAEQPDEGAPPVFKVIALPESFFVLRTAEPQQ